MQVVIFGFPVSNQKTVNTGSGAKVHTEVSCVGRSVEFKADVCLCGFWFFVVVNVGVVKLTFVILLKIRVGSVFLSRQNNHLFLLFCFGKKVSSENTGFGKPALFSDTAEWISETVSQLEFLQGGFCQNRKSQVEKNRTRVGGWVGMDNTVRVWHNKLKQSSSVNFG